MVDLLEGRRSELGGCFDHLAQAVFRRVAHATFVSSFWSRVWHCGDYIAGRGSLAWTIRIRIGADRAVERRTSNRSRSDKWFHIQILVLHRDVPSL